VRAAVVIVLLGGCHKLFSLQKVELEPDARANDASNDASETCFRETFDGTLAETLGDWDRVVDTSCGVDVTDGALVITLPSTPCYSWLALNRRISFEIGDVAHVTVQQVTPDDKAETFMSLNVDYQNMYRMYKAETGLLMRVRVAGVDVVDESTPYDPLVHAYWRIRRDETSMNFETSVDDVEWTTRASTPTTTLAVSSLQVQLGAGVYQNLATPGPVEARIDDFAHCTP
jgi:hypothetical protein